VHASQFFVMERLSKGGFAWSKSAIPNVICL
jgi:hypothetical protein